MADVVPARDPAPASAPAAPPTDRARLDELADLRTPWCILVAATLRITERLAAGAADVRDLAAAAGCDAFALHCVLSHLASRGVLTESERGRFELNDAARYLLAPAIEKDLDGLGGRFSEAWGTMLTWVRTGRAGYRERFGLPFWEDLDAHPALGAAFDALMGPAGHGTPEPDLPLAGGWESVRTLVDVGGGTGALLAQMLRRWPHLAGTLVDLPRTVARSGEILEAAAVASRATVRGQSFFDPLPAGADVYLLAKVLNDWPDREKVAILRRCTEAAPPGGRVLVAGGVRAEDAPPRLGHELVLLGARTSTLPEFRELARQAGLEVTAAQQRPSGGLVVECRRAERA